MVPKWPVSPCGHLQCRVAPPFSSDYRHSSQAAAGAQTTTISLLKTGKKAERKMLERGLMTKGTAATAGPGMVRGGCHCVTPGPGCYTGSDVAAADSGHRGHRSPRRIGCDWWRVCSVRCRHSGPRCTGRPFYLYLVYLPGCTVSIQTLYSTQTGFFTGWLSALCSGHWTPAWVRAGHEYRQHSGRDTRCCT